MMEGLKPVQEAERDHLRQLLASGLLTDLSAAIDGGAHVGGWSMLLAEHFGTVYAFEPGEEAFAMLERNTAGMVNIVPVCAALMDHAGSVEVFEPGRATLTARQVRFKADGLTQAVTIDSLGLEACGLIKLDVEGAEYLALEGARETIERCRPFLVIEMVGLGKRFGRSDAAVESLVTGLGYRQVWSGGVDKGFAR